MPAVQETGIIQRITELSEQAAIGTGIEVAEVQLRGAGRARLLRVYIESRAASPMATVSSSPRNWASCWTRRTQCRARVTRLRSARLA